MDEILDENISISKTKILKKSDLLELKRKQSKMIREQSTNVPVYQAPELNLEDVLEKKKPKTSIPFNRQLIMEVLREAGVDVSKQVSLNRNNYEKSFRTAEDDSIDKLIKHNKALNNLGHPEIKDRSEFRKINKEKLEQKRKQRHFEQQNLLSISSNHLKNIKNKIPSTLQQVETELWNKEQKLEETLNLPVNEEMDENSCESLTEIQVNNNGDRNLLFKKSVSLDDDLSSEQFPTFESFQDIDENIRIPSFMTKNKEDNLKIFDDADDGNKFDDCNNLPMLCSGKFFTQDTENENISQKNPPPHAIKNKLPPSFVESEKSEPDFVPENLHLKQSLMDKFVSINSSEKKHQIQTNSIKSKSLSDLKNNFDMKDFIEDEAEQSGDEVSLGSEGQEVSEIGSLVDFISEHQEVGSANEEVDHQNTRQAHFNDILMQDELEVEAIRALHFPDDDKLPNASFIDDPEDINETKFDYEERQALILNANRIPDDNTYSDSPDEGDVQDIGINKIRSRLIAGYSSFSDSLKISSKSTFHPHDDDNAILPDYVADPNNLLSRIQTPSQRTAIKLSSFDNSSSMISFIGGLKSKGIQSIEPNSLSLKNGSSACVFASSDSHHSNPGASKSYSNDASKVGECKKENEPKIPPIPVGSIFSFVKQR